MKCAIKPTPGFRRSPKHVRGSGAIRRQAAFTFAEVLVALAFMAVVVPVTLEGLRITNRAGLVAERKAAAAHLGNRILNELVITRTWSAAPGGTIENEGKRYRWTARTVAWPFDSLRVLTVGVLFTVQEREYEVQLSTLVDDSTAL